MGFVFLVIWFVNLIAFWKLLNFIETKLNHTTWKKFADLFGGLATITKAALSMGSIIVFIFGLALTDEEFFHSSFLPSIFNEWYGIILFCFTIDFAMFAMYLCCFLVMMPFAKTFGSAYFVYKKMAGNDSVTGGFLLILNFVLIFVGILFLAMGFGYNPDPLYQFLGILLLGVGMFLFIGAIVRGWNLTG